MVRTRKRFERFAGMIPAGAINKESTALLKNMQEFFKKTECDEITFETFWPFLLTKYSQWNAEKQIFWKAAVKPLDYDNPPGLDETIITNLLSTEMSNKIVEAIAKYQAGEEIDIIEEAQLIVEATQEALVRKVKTPEVQADWQEMIEEEENMSGIHWRLPALAGSLRPLRPGDFGIIAMRPGTGKTTLGASEFTYMVPQLEAYFGEKRTGIWLNNEGPGSRILYRQRQAALGKSAGEIAAMGWEEAKREFTNLMGGDESILQVLDIHGFTNVEVEDVFRKKRPGIVVFDMIDNIRFSGLGANNGERNDQILESMYQWARACCVKYDFIGIAMSQLSVNADGVAYPLLGDLKDSKTGKQGACDFIITGGYMPATENLRYIGVTKTKLNMQGRPANPKATVHFDADRARLRMPEEVIE